MPPSYRAAVFLLLLVALPPPPTAAAKSRRAPTTAFGRSAWVRKLTLLGSASILPGQIAVALTTNTSDGIGAGRALFTEPVHLLLPPTDPRGAPVQVSFSTRFTFRIEPSPSYGDGLAFLLTSSRTFLGASNGFLGLYPSAPHPGDRELADVHTVAVDLADVYTVAVELDTHRDVALHDPDGNHVALDAGSIFSIASASPGLDLKAGVPITAWVEYRAPRRRLRAWLSFSSSRRPVKPALSVKINLSALLRGTVFIGFSASNGEGAAFHVIESWAFRTYVPHKRSQGPPPPTPSPPAKDHLKPTLPIPTDHHHRHLNIMTGVLGIVILLVLSVIFCKLLVRRHTKSVKSEELSVLPKQMARSC